MNVADFISDVEAWCDSPEDAMAELRSAQLAISEELGRLEALIIDAVASSGKGDTNGDQ